MSNETKEEQSKELHKQFVRAELKQNMLLRLVTVVLMLVLGSVMTSPYENPQNPIAQKIFYLASAAGFFFICYVMFRVMISSGSSARVRSAQRTFAVLVALSLVFLGIMEKLGWYDQLISYLVSLSPEYLEKAAEVFGFVLLAAISGVIGNFTYHLLTKLWGNGRGE